MSISRSIRKELIILARRSDARTSAFSSDRPTDWRPGSVRNPHGGFEPSFTDASAWDFIADRLEADCEVETIILKKPPGAKGYVMLIELEPCERPVYIKVQLGSGKIIGRSFHYSEHY